MKIVDNYCEDLVVTKLTGLAVDSCSLALQTKMADVTRSLPSEKSSQNQAKKRKKKKQKTHRPVTETSPSTRKDSKVINTYHALKKRLESVSIDKRLSDHEKAQLSSEITAKMEQLGGLDAYQKASKLGESRHGGFNAAKWVVGELKAHNIRSELQAGEECSTSTGNSEKLRLLDVGALDHNYKKHGWIDCTPIDLNPQNSSIKKMDFLQLKTKELFHVIVLSLVINFEGDVNKRGQMLKKCCKLLHPGGHVVIVLPLPCVTNSRFFSAEVLHLMMESLGFVDVSQHTTAI
ncbi:25S rRNA adenine-N(1) methyltransferase isoform X2 [Nematostella vectensis]|uniref:25S rRNA adenine-N(1) methyltransferase isoform X2 n=1 Tax=Nematostella vectensis TaxID=45351 RepID=UPI0020770986|nr:25S rRNA adenine-N(1) methyltransferase isoform X2 [Nematostella vectensis]